MGRIGIEDFIGFRTRFQRTSDAKLFAGWINDFKNNLVTVSTKNSNPLAAGEQFRFEGHGDKHCVAFFGKLAEMPRFRVGSAGSITALGESGGWMIESKNLRIDFQLTSPVVLGASREEMRILLKDIPVKLSNGTKECSGVTTDVSWNGLGVLTKACVPSQETIDLECITSLGPINFRAQCRYTIKEDSSVQSYRSGFLITEIDRVNKSRWKQLIGDTLSRFEKSA